MRITKISVLLLLFYSLRLFLSQALPQVSLQALFSQDFQSVNLNLEQLEDLITATLLNTKEQQNLLETLQQNLSESGNLIENYTSTINRQEQLLGELQIQLNTMSETYRKQSALSAKYEQKLKFWKTFTLVAVPAAALISGTVVWATLR